MPGDSSTSGKVLVIDDSPTILKVVTLVLAKAGFQVTTAPDGEVGLERARERRPDMILLDFVMPRMNGYQVCRGLAADESLKDIPVVLMSAKGDQVGERFVKVMGIVDYITKPFSPEAITAVVQHTIGKYGTQSGSRASSVSSEVVPPPPEADEAATTLGTPARAQGGDEAPALEGDLRIIPVADVLHLLETQCQSGILQVKREGGQVDIHFRQGRVDFAGAQGVSEEFLLGRFLLELQLISQQDLESFLKSRTPGAKLLGGQLVKLGYLSDLELKQALARQTCELVYEILRWNFGRFTFRATRDLPPVAVDASLGLEVEGILMEGFRRVDEWHLIEREIDDFDQVFLRNEDAVAQMGRGRLTREEQSVLELVNGKHTVKEIVRQSRMGSFDVSKMLYRLLSTKLIRRRVMPVAV